MRRLLLTGAAGRIATAVRPVLRELAEEVVLTDRVAVDGPAPGERFVRAELADPAPAGIDGVGLKRGGSASTPNRHPSPRRPRCGR